MTMKCVISNVRYIVACIFMITQLFETKDDQMETSNICVTLDSNHCL